MAKECSSTTCDKTSCEGCSHKEPKSLQETMNVYSNIKHVIGVVSCLLYTSARPTEIRGYSFRA